MAALSCSQKVSSGAGPTVDPAPCVKGLSARVVNKDRKGQVDELHMGLQQPLLVAAMTTTMITGTRALPVPCPVQTRTQPQAAGTVCAPDLCTLCRAGLRSHCLTCN